MIPNRREALEAFRRPSAPLYVGAMGNRTNVGDDLLFLAHRSLLDHPVAAIPMGGNNRLLALRLRRSPVLPLLLGGGTLIGRPAYRHALAAAIDHPRARVSAAMLGPGVSAPDGTGKSSSAELRAWVPLLRQFPTIRVRGPRSAAHLGDVGVEAEVVGDPVLALLRPHREPTRPTDDALHIGVNGADVPGMAAVVPTLVAALADVAARSGRRIEVTALAASDYDAPANDRLAAAVAAAGTAVRTVSLSGAQPADVAAAMAHLDAVVPVRLHIGVAAAALDIGCVSLPYEDKCHDFLDSVEADPDDRCDLPGAERGWLADRVLRSVCSAQGAPVVTAAVDRLVAAQRSAAEAVRQELGLCGA